MKTDREAIITLVKNWAQSHSYNWVISVDGKTSDAVSQTSGFLTWVVREKDVNLDLLDLVNRLEYFLEKKKKKDPDGEVCDNCKEFVQFASPNSPNDSFICYLCRQDPLPRFKK